MKYIFLMKRRIMDIKKFKKIFKGLIFFNIIISIFFLLGYNVIELEKIDILPDITYILFHFFITLLSIYSNIFMYNTLLKDNHKKLFFWYFIFSLILIFCCYLVYDLNMGINISYIIRKIGDL